MMFEVDPAPASEMLDEQFCGCTKMLDMIFEHIKANFSTFDESTLLGKEAFLKSRLSKMERMPLGTMIERPMDLLTIKKRLDGVYYRSPLQEFRDDVGLVVKNVQLSYSKDCAMYQNVTALAAEFDKWWTHTDSELKSREAFLKSIFHEESAERDLIYGYLSHVKTSVGSYVDSASGQVRQIDGESISLVLFKNESFDYKCSDGQDAQDFICPLSCLIMHDPVTCSDNQTYERAWIEKVFNNCNQGGISPLTRKSLEFEETTDGKTKTLVCKPNVNLREKIQKFKEEKLAELNLLKQNAEGEEERRLFRNRYGFVSRSTDSNGQNEGTQMDSAKDLLDWLISHPVTRLACMTGPPASGKTVTMLQIVYAAVNECNAQMDACSKIPFLPLFMRATELPALLLETDKVSENLRNLVQSYLVECVRQKTMSHDMEILILRLFDLDRILVCIDGLDEAATDQEMVEAIIENAVKIAAKSHRHVRMLLSTREHSFIHSRACLRLLDFDVVDLQPLRKEHQLNMIKGRVPVGKIDSFELQLKILADQNLELTTSPFLLSLMIEVYNMEGAIPTKRVELYSKQVKAVVARCIQRRVAEGESFVDLCVGKLTGDEAALSLAIELLEALAFSCQMPCPPRLETRDFTLDVCAFESLEGWKHDSQRFNRTRDLLFRKPVVGLLTCVGTDGYRFSHLTLQEYLAARFSFHLYRQAPRELLQLFSIEREITVAEPLHPLHSPWKKEVLQFTACMLFEEETKFEDFCKLLLAEEKGMGAHCEIVQDFLSECGESEQVGKMLCHKMREIRNDKWIAGLCHPSLELRQRIVSEMRQFRAVSLSEGGIVASLIEIAEGTKFTWCKRVAAILSLTQIAQMEFGHHNCRTIILEWMLEKLAKIQSDSVGSEEENVAIVKGLGILFQQAGVEIGAADFFANDASSIQLSSADDSLLMGIVERAVSLEQLAVAIADVRVISDGLVDWLVGNPAVISSGTWPMRHLRMICVKLVSFHDTRSCERFTDALIRRLHACSFVEEDRNLLLDSLRHMFTILPQNEGPSQVLGRLKFGMAHQRVRVLEAVEHLNIQFSSKDADQLAQCMFLEPAGDTEVAGAGNLAKNFLSSPPVIGRAGHELPEKDENPVFSVTPGLDFAKSVMSDISVKVHYVPEILETSLLSYISRQKPTMLQFLLDLLKGSRTTLELEQSGATVQHLIARLIDFKRTSEEKIKIDVLTAESKPSQSKFNSLPSVVTWNSQNSHAISTQQDVNDEIQPTHPKFNSLPSVVSWNSQNCYRSPPPQTTMHALEALMRRTSAGNVLMELRNPIKHGSPKLSCVCAMIWECTGLMHEHFVSQMCDQSQLTGPEVMEAKHMFNYWQLLKEPWIPEPANNYGTLLMDSTTADVTFQVKGQLFPAHWFVVAPRNDFFRDLFEAEMGWSSAVSKVIVLKHVSAEALKVLFRFLYTYELPEQEDCGEGLATGEMVEVASRFKATPLYEHCKGLFVQRLEVGNAIQRLVIAHDRNLKQLEKLLMEYLQQNSHTFQREAMETLDILKNRPELINCTVQVTIALCSGLVTTQVSQPIGLGSGSTGNALLTVSTWIPDLKSKYHVWVWHICNALKLDTLGRFVFSIVLHHIHRRFESNPTTA